MPFKFGSPRNEASRRDRIAGAAIIKSSTRNHKSRNDRIGVTVLLGGIPGNIAGESEMVAGGGVATLTLTGASWHPDIGADNAITTALLAGITGSDSGGNGYNDEIATALDYTGVDRTSAAVVSITFPEAASYAISDDEIITIVVPASAIQEGIAPINTQSFTVVNES